MLDKQKFIKCENEWKSAPFYSLNGNLNKEKIEHQIEQMYKQGIGGFFMHPRAGLENAYMEDEYLDAIEHCIKKAEELGMFAWLYDEDRFPSGVAGGKVVSEEPEYASQSVYFKECNDKDLLMEDENVLAIFIKDDALTYKYLQDKTGIDTKDNTFIVFYTKKNSCSSVYNDTPYVDLCNKKAVDSFLDKTHEVYKKRFENYFGNVIPGIFTDEPDFGHRPSIYDPSYPWTKALQEEFFLRKGYHIVEHLPKLFFEYDNYKKIRVDYWDVLTNIFNESFVKNINEWCEKNNLIFTGHFWEHFFPVPWINGSVMPYYKNMQQPGIDMLFKPGFFSEQYGNDLIVKEVSSIGNQFGKKRIISESYGAAGWDLDFKDQKLMADWQFALGINFICQHLVYYSFEGYRKRDWPLSFSEQQPWWDRYHLLSDYIGRLSYVLSQGKYDCDVLILHPSISTWAQYTPLKAESNMELNEIGIKMKELCVTLNEMHIQYDIGDEIILRENAEVESNSLIIGESTYKTIIIPKMEYMLSSTYNLLKLFVKSGGRLILTDEPPLYIDGEIDYESQNFFKENTLKIENSASYQDFYSNTQNEIIFTNGNSQNLYCHRRTNENNEIIFICNISKEETVKTQLRIKNNISIEKWDAINGDIQKVDMMKDENGFFVEVILHPIESILFVMCKSEENNSILDKKAILKMEDKKVLSNWKVSLSEQNVYVLDKCSALVDKEEFLSDNVLRIDDKIKDKLNIPRYHVFSKQPWMYSAAEKNNNFSVTLKYYFNITEKPSTDIYLALEFSELYEVFINGKRSEKIDGHFMDTSIKKMCITEFLAVGINEICLKTKKYSLLMGVESVYLIGHFELSKGDMGFSIAKAKEIGVGDITAQGYPFYTGKVIYETFFEVNEYFKKAMLKINDYNGMMAEVEVNDQLAGSLAWQPYMLDICDKLIIGKNKIRIIVYSSLQNLFGPHGKNFNTGIAHPLAFYCDDDKNLLEIGFDGDCEIEFLHDTLPQI